MVVPERKTPRGRALPESKIHGGIGFARMYDCFTYEGLSPEEAARRFRRMPRPLDEHVSLLIDGRENGIFSVMTFEARGRAAHVFPPRFAVAVVTRGAGTLSLGGETASVRRGDRLLLKLDDSPLAAEAEGGKALSLVVAMPTERGV